MPEQAPEGRRGRLAGAAFIGLGIAVAGIAISLAMVFSPSTKTASIPSVRSPTPGVASSALTDAERVYCAGNLRKVLAAAQSLGMQPAARATVYYPFDRLSFEMNPGLFSGPNSYLSKFIDEAERQAAIPGRWPKYTGLEAVGNVGDSPRYFKWYEGRDFPRACKAAYESR